MFSPDDIKQLVQHGLFKPVIAELYALRDDLDSYYDGEIVYPSEAVRLWDMGWLESERSARAHILGRIRAYELMAHASQS